MRSRAIAAIRWLGARRAILPLTARLLSAGTVRESLVFVARELLRPRGMRIYRLRASGVRVAIRHEGVDAATLAEVFYRRFYEPPEDAARAIGEASSILDLGANIGLFGAFAVARWPTARIVAYEPDPANATVHRRTIQANGLQDRWGLEPIAAGSFDGEVRFAAGLNAGSHVLVAHPPSDSSQGAGAEIAVAQRDVLPLIAGADLVKMDIEGGEWEILDEPRFAQSPPRAIVLEYHPDRCPDGDPRAAAERALQAAGLDVASIWHGADGHGMLWGWRR